MFKPVKMAKIAIMGLRKNQQASVSILHDMEILQLEPLSKDVLDIVKNERDNELTRQISDELLRVKALMTVLPSIPVTVRKRFDSIDDLLQTTSSIDVDEQVASLEKEKEALLTEIKYTENNLKLVEEFSFFPEDLKFSNFHLQLPILEEFHLTSLRNLRKRLLHTAKTSCFMLRLEKS